MEVNATIANDLGDKVVDRQCAKFSIHTHMFSDALCTILLLALISWEVLHTQ